MITEEALVEAKAASLAGDSTLLTQAQVCTFLRVSHSTLARMRKSGEGPKYLKIGPRLVKYRPSAVLEWLNANQTNYR